MPGVQGGPLMHVIAGKAVALREALTPEWKAYQRQIVANARALCGGSARPRIPPGHRGRNAPPPGRPDQPGGDRQGRPGGPRPSVDHGQQEHHSLRVAEPHGDERYPPRHAAVTTRGMREGEMAVIAGLIDRVLGTLDPRGVEAAVRGDVQSLTSRFPLYPEG